MQTNVIQIKLSISGGFYQGTQNRRIKKQGMIIGIKLRDQKNWLCETRLMKTFKRLIPDICFLEPGSSAPLAKHIAWREIPVFAASLCYLLNLPSIMHSVIDNEIIPHSDEKKIQTIAELKLVFIFAPSLGSIAQLVQSTCLTSRGSQVRTLLLPQRKVTFGGFFLFLPITVRFK